MKCLKLLIILPLICSPFNFSSFLNINWEFNFDFGKYLTQLKSVTPEYITKIQKGMSEFIKKTEKEKDKYLDKLSNKVKESYNKVKAGIKKGSENIKEEMKELIETTTETAKTLSYKVCDMLKSDYDKCFNNKKKIFNDLIQIVDENFGQCSKIVNEIHNLSDNIEFNLKYFLFLAISLSENPDIIQKGTSQIVYDVINCLKEKIPNLISDSNLSKKVDFLNIKQDIINLLMKSMSNFVNFIKFEEAYGYIKKAENLTGFIKDENAVKVYKNIFDILKQFNQFGTQKYEISTNLNLNVFSNNASNQLIKSIEHEDKGIKINLHLSYILENFKVHSVQAVVFDSPLVSFKLERKSKGGISNIFVGITLYDKDGNEIYVKDIKLDKIEILFKKNIYKAMKTCLYYNEDKNIMDNNGINTEYVEFDGIEYIKCIPKHLSSFTIGSLDEEEEYIIQQKSNNSKNILKYGLLKIIMTIIIVFVFIYLFRVWRKKRIEAINNQYNA